MSILIFLAVLVVLVLVHELGHFLVAKKFGIRVDEFGIGFPPKIFGKKYGETEYTLNALPLGGFVKIYGEDPTQEHIDGPDSARSFVHKPKLVQAAVLVAGVTMNVLLAWVLLTAGFMFGMPTAVDEDNVSQVKDVRLLITGVLPNSPAAENLKASDEIQSVAVAGVTLEGSELVPSTVIDLVADHPDESITFSVLRRGEPLIVLVVPKTGVLPDEPERAAAGFMLSFAGTRQLPAESAIIEGSKMTWYMLTDVVKGLGNLLFDAVRGKADIAQVSGPVGIVGMVGDAASLGFAWLITFTAFISLNLAVINLLPFPALDGGRLLFVIIESITRRPIKPKIANTLNYVGFALLLTLMAVVTVNDVVKLF